MFYGNLTILTEKDKIMRQMHFLENKTGLMLHVLKMQKISLLPEYIK
jgi:hypothetical protein